MPKRRSKNIRLRSSSTASGIRGNGSVDDCELDKDATLSSNCFVPLILAEAALRNNIKLVHISSGCIYHYDYSKRKPITEDEPPDFFDLFYSRTKIYAERALEILSKSYNILSSESAYLWMTGLIPKMSLIKSSGIKKSSTAEFGDLYSGFYQGFEASRHYGRSRIYNVVNNGGVKISRATGCL